MRTLNLCVAVVCVLAGKLAAEDLQPIEAETAQKFARMFSEEAGKIAKPQVKIMPDAEKANGVHVPHKVGVLVVPQKELRESDELAAKFKEGKGAELAYLFLYNLVPVLDGQRVAADKLHMVEMPNASGGKDKVHLLLLTVRQPAEDDYRLPAYGPDEKPLIDAKFAAGAASGSGPVSIEIKDVDKTTRQGRLVLTVFGKYQASFTCEQSGE